MIKLRDILFNTNADQQVLIRLNKPVNEVDGCCKVSVSRIYEGSVAGVCSLLGTRTGTAEQGNYLEYYACITEISGNRIVVDCSCDTRCYDKTDLWRSK